MMLRALVTLALAAGVPASAMGQTTAPKPVKQDNAALTYWQAFAILPPLNKERNQILDEWDTVKLAGSALALIDESRKSLVLLHRGARTESCDWGLNKEDGADLLLPHASKARELAKYAMLAARHQMATGKTVAGVDTLADVMALARHVGTDSSFVGLLVQYALENRVIDMLGRYLPDLDAAARRHVSQRLKSLPPGGNFKNAVRTEKEIFIGATIRQLEEKRVVPNKGLEALLRAAGGPRGPVTLLKEVGAFYDTVNRLPVLPRDQFWKRVAEEAKKLEGNPFLKLLLPACDKVYEAEERAEAKRAMLQAALAVIEGGPEALKTVRDPFGDGPFECRALKNGFELKSKPDKGPPVTLAVGHGPK